MENQCPIDRSRSGRKGGQFKLGAPASGWNRPIFRALFPLLGQRDKGKKGSLRAPLFIITTRQDRTGQHRTRQDKTRQTTKKEGRFRNDTTTSKHDSKLEKTIPQISTPSRLPQHHSCSLSNTGSRNSQPQILPMSPAQNQNAYSFLVQQESGVPYITTTHVPRHTQSTPMTPSSFPCVWIVSRMRQ